MLTLHDGNQDSTQNAKQSTHSDINNKVFIFGLRKHNLIDNHLIAVEVRDHRFGRLFTSGRYIGCIERKGKG